MELLEVSRPDKDGRSSSYSRGEILHMFSKHVGVCDSNETEVLAILEGFKLFFRRYGGSLVTESDSSYVIAWVSKQKVNPWKLQLYFNEIWELAASIKVNFYHEFRSANSMVDVLPKQVVDRLVPYVGVIM